MHFFEAPGLSGLFLRFTVMSILINLKKTAHFLVNVIH